MNILHPVVLALVFAGASASAQPTSAYAFEAPERGAGRGSTSIGSRFGPGVLVVEGERRIKPVSGSGTGARQEEVRRAPAWLCAIDNDILTDTLFGPDCAAEDPGAVLGVTPTCQPGERVLEPLFRRVQTAQGWSPWEQIGQGGCVVDVDIRAAIAQELQRLPLTPSTLSVQPPSGWTLVHADTVAFADDDEQVLTTTVLGFAVAIRATPTSFTWDFGDGSAPLTTRDPGRPWPEHTIAHRYLAEGTHRITLTTTWSAVFQIAGTAGWEPVDGTATTTSTSEPLVVHEARSHLVAGPTT